MGAPMSAGAVRRDEQNHCKDCCCARSWEALGVTTYTGMSIVEHIEQLVAQRDALHAQDVALVAVLKRLIDADERVEMCNAQQQACELLTQLDQEATCQK
jgi:hypothetical protein